MGNRKRQIHELICKAIENNTVCFRVHSLVRSNERYFEVEDVFYSVIRGAVLEEQEDLNRLPKFIVRGRTKTGQLLESVWAYNERNGWATLISMFSPDHNTWNKSHLRRR